MTGPSADSSASEEQNRAHIPDDVAARIDAIAEEFVRTATRDRFDPGRRRAIDEVARLGTSELMAGAIAERRLLEGRDARFQVQIAENLTRLREGVEELQRDIVAGRVDRRRTERLRGRIDEVLQALGDGSRALEQDTAALLQEQHILWTQVGMIERFAYMAQRMDERLLEFMAGADQAGADAIRDDVLLPLRSRRADLALQLAVSLQASAALRIVEGNNRDLIGAIRTATGTTIAALRTSQFVSEALRQRQASGVGSAESSAGSGAGSGGAAAVAATVGAATLQEAWDDVFAAIQRVEEVKRNVAAGWRPALPEPGQTGVTG